MTSSFALLLAVGKLLIFLGQKFVASNSKNAFINRLFDCDLCLGTWVYIGLALAFKVAIFQDVYGYVPLVSEVVTGAVATFGMHLLSLGWRMKFAVEVI